MSLKDKYVRLPEWIRWIICWPISLIIAVLTWFFFHSAAVSYGGYHFILKILHPVIVQVLFLYFIYETVPRAKLPIVVTLIILRALILVVLLAGVFLGAFNVLEDFDLDLNYWFEIIGEIVTLVASVSLYIALRKCKVWYTDG